MTQTLEFLGLVPQQQIANFRKQMICFRTEIPLASFNTEVKLQWPVVKPKVKNRDTPQAQWKHSTLHETRVNIILMDLFI